MNSIDAKIEPQIALIGGRFLRFLLRPYFGIQGAITFRFLTISNEFLASIHARLSLGCKGFTKNSRFPQKIFDLTFTQELKSVRENMNL